MFDAWKYGMQLFPAGISCAVPHKLAFSTLFSNNAYFNSSTLLRNGTGPLPWHLYHRVSPLEGDVSAVSLQLEKFESGPPARLTNGRWAKGRAHSVGQT